MLIGGYLLEAGHSRTSAQVVPYFLPMVLDTKEVGPVYLPEDVAFCKRARQCGYKIMLDTRIRLWHIGKYKYGWEDASTVIERVSTFNV